MSAQYECQVTTLASRALGALAKHVLALYRHTRLAWMQTYQRDGLKNSGEDDPGVRGNRNSRKSYGDGVDHHKHSGQPSHLLQHADHSHDFHSPFSRCLVHDKIDNRIGHHLE